MENKCGTIYHITCDNDRTHTYIGESKRLLGVRFKEDLNLDKPTGVGEHCLPTGHSVSKSNISVPSREQEWHRHKVKEAIYIKQHGLTVTMNHDQGYQLPPIYTQILTPVSGSCTDNQCVIKICRSRSKRCAHSFHQTRSKVS